MSTLNRLTKQVDSLGSAWEQFKSINDRRLAEVEKKGHADALTVDHLNRINNVIDGCKSRLDTMETAIARPAMGFEMDRFARPELAEHKEAFCMYLRKGIEDDLVHLEKKALSAASDPDGGYLITPQMSAVIAKSVYETSPVRQLAGIETISSDSLEIIEDTDGSSFTQSFVLDKTTADIYVKQVLRAEKHITLKDGIAAPSTVSGEAAIYVDTADGDLKVKFGDGTVKTIVTD